MNYFKTMYLTFFNEGGSFVMILFNYFTKR